MFPTSYSLFRYPGRLDFLLFANRFTGDFISSRNSSHSLAKVEFLDREALRLENEISASLFYETKSQAEFSKLPLKDNNGSHENNFRIVMLFYNWRLGNENPTY